MVSFINKFNPPQTGKQFTGTLANSKDPDEMP